VTAPEALPVLAGCLALLVALAALRDPLMAAVRLALRTGAGLLSLALLAPLGAFVGAGLGVNLLNALVLGVLGVPGLGLLLMLNWALR